MVFLKEIFESSGILSIRQKTIAILKTAKQPVAQTQVLIVWYNPSSHVTLHQVNIDCLVKLEPDRPWVGLGRLGRAWAGLGFGQSLGRAWLDWAWL